MTVGFFAPSATHFYGKILGNAFQVIIQGELK
jgi:hypothetical protein